MPWPERIALMPDWPARMDDDMAALYLGVGVTTFRDKVKARLSAAGAEGARCSGAASSSTASSPRSSACRLTRAAAGASRGSWDDL
jgi:hypothetical protein